MVIVGGFLGGPAGAIPAGYGVINLQWDTVDRLNIAGASFTITGGGQTYTVAADATGRAEKTVPVGSYTVSVTHTGTYSNDGAKSVIVENMESYLVYFEGRLIAGGTTFTGPITSATWTIKKGTTTKYTGMSMPSPYTVSLEPGSDYSITLSMFGDTATKNFIVYETQTAVDLTDLYCHLTISNPTGIECTLKYNGNAIASDLYVIRSSTSNVITGTVSTSYGGASTSLIASVPSQNVTPNALAKTHTLVLTGTVVTITDTSTLTVPVTGKFHILAIGGGGGGGAYGTSYSYTGGGGGSGYVSDSTIDVTGGDYSIMIGGGGALNKAGSATSFGTLVSVSGGSPGQGKQYNQGPGGEGGASGGRGGSSGGAGITYGGSGGYGYGGASGGSGGKDGGGPAGGNGASGVTTPDPFYGSGSASGGAGAPSGSDGKDGGGGGGGGGGYNATGGAGGLSAMSYYGGSGGGGGGGGIGGGTGGSGGKGATINNMGGTGGRGVGYGGGGGGIGSEGHDGGGVAVGDGGGGGGGGGGGLGPTVLNISGSVAGAPGAVRIQWVSAS